MVYFLAFIVFITVFIFSNGIFALLNRDKMNIKNRIDQIEAMHIDIGIDIADNIPFSQRAIKPFYDYLSKLILKVTPNNNINNLNKKLERAGLLKNCNIERWMYIKIMAMLILFILSGILTYKLEPNILKTLFFSAFTVLITEVCFNFYLSREIEIRKNKMLKDLPFTLDLIVVSVEAGLSFDGAMARVINNISGELCDEFAKCLKETMMGIQRKVALRSMGDRCQVKELSMLITSLIQAEEMGVGLGKVLRIEALNLREHRKQVAREKAMKAPIKMLFPLIFFIFPSIFIVILGPAVIKIMKVFSR